MKIALCTTTIHVPHALKLLRKCSTDVKFFVAPDTRTPEETIELCDTSENVEAVFGRDWKCSAAIGWNTLARRNIAFLEALKWGADVIYSWDDDNLPMMPDHFDLISNTIEMPFDGIRVGGHDWFDPGALLIPPTRHRGYPYDIPRLSRAEAVTNVKVGVAAGLIIGNPDVDASTRIELKPDIASAHLLGQVGVVVDPHTRTVFNTQNTAVIRELIPAWFLMPGVGRHDDIYASLIVQRVMRERDYHVHFGQPFCYQQRNEHNLVADLRAEIDGMENVAKLAAALDIIILPGYSVLGDTRIIYSALRHCEFLPTDSVEAALLWLEDCEGVL